MSATSARKRGGGALSAQAGRMAAWEQEHARVRTMWVVVILFFWFSVGLQVVLVVMSGKANFILLSVIGGMMVLGVALKLRLQRIRRNRPEA